MRKVKEQKVNGGSFVVLDGGFSAEYPGMWVRIYPDAPVSDNDWGITYQGGMVPMKDFQFHWYWESEEFRAEVENLITQVTA